MAYKIGDEVKVIDYWSFYFGQIGDIQDKPDEDGDCKVKFADDWNYVNQSQLAPAHTLDALTPGDVVVDENGEEQMVLERLSQTVLLSDWDDFKNAGEWYCIEQLKVTHTLKDTPKEIVEETLINEFKAMRDRLLGGEPTGAVNMGGRSTSDYYQQGQIDVLDTVIHKLTKALGGVRKN